MRSSSQLSLKFVISAFYRAFEDKRSHYEPSVAGAVDEQDHIALDDHDFYVPHFQRVSISGEDTSGVSV